MKLFSTLVVATSICFASLSVATAANKPELVLTQASAKTSGTYNLTITPLQDGSASNISQYIGNGTWTLVLFWSSVMALQMTDEVRALSEEADESELIVVGVSIDPEGKINSDRQRQYLEAVTFPNYRVNNPGVAFKSYKNLTKKQFRGTPTLLLFNPEGEVAAIQAGIVKRDLIKKFIAENK